MLQGFFETYRQFLACTHPVEQSIKFDVRAKEATGKWCHVCGSVCIEGTWHPPSAVGVLRAREGAFLELVTKLADDLGAGSEAARELEDAFGALGKEADEIAAVDRADALGRLAAHVKMLVNAAGLYFHEGAALCGRLGVQCTIHVVGTEARARSLEPLVAPPSVPPPSDTERPTGSSPEPFALEDDDDPDSRTRSAIPGAEADPFADAG